MTDSTIRTHLEAIRDRHEAVVTGPPINDISCGTCNPYTVHECPCPTYADAVAALRILDDLEHVWRRSPTSLLQTDPMMGYPERAEHFRLLPDPVGVRDAKEPA